MVTSWVIRQVCGATIIMRVILLIDSSPPFNTTVWNPFFLIRAVEAQNIATRSTELTRNSVTFRYTVGEAEKSLKLWCYFSLVRVTKLDSLTKQRFRATSLIATDMGQCKSQALGVPEFDFDDSFSDDLEMEDPNVSSKLCQMIRAFAENGEEGRKGGKRAFPPEDAKGSWKWTGDLLCRGEDLHRPLRQEVEFSSVKYK